MNEMMNVVINIFSTIKDICITYGITLLSAGIGTIGFFILFRINKRHMLYGFLGGVLTCAIYLVSIEWMNQNLLIANLCAAMGGACYSSACAKLRKAPENVFLIPCLVPLVPGSMLYYAMSNLLARNEMLFRRNLVDATETALGIAAGIVAATVIDYYVQRIFRKKIQKSEH